MKVDFLIFIEHRARELENACLLKYELEKRGYCVALSNTSFWGSIKTFKKLQPEVIIVPWLYDNIDVEFYQSFKEMDTYKIVNLQYEQIYNQKVRMSGSRYPKDFAKNFQHICWGEKSERYLLESGISQKNVLLTGSLGLDFNRAEMRGYHMGKNEIAKTFSLPSEKKWHLFVSSFGIAETTQQQIEEIVEKLDAPEYFEFKKIAIQSKEEILDWIVRYITLYKEEIFIYRPHPSESQDSRLIELQKTHSNFRVIGEFSIKAWILACDVIHNWYSTSIADIYFLDKNSSILRPVNIPSELEVEILQGGDFITNYKEFEFFSQNSHCFNFPIDKRNILEFYHYTDLPAYKIISDKLIDIYLNSNRIEALELEAPKKLKRDKWYNRAIIDILTELTKHYKISQFVPTSRKNYIERMEKESYKIEEEIKLIETKIKKLLD